MHIHDRWDWTVSNPVVRLSFDAKYSEPGDLENHVIRQIAKHEKRAGIEPSPLPGDGAQRLEDLIFNLYDATKQQVVVLVDEYDKPILDLLENPEQAIANREYLRGVYGVIKGCAEEIRFVFVTGISMYSKD